MPGIARVNSQDVAGAVIVGPGSRTVMADYKVVSLIGDKVAGHGPGPHAGPILVSNGAQKILIDGIVPAKQGTLASCGHPVTPGSSTVIVP